MINIDKLETALDIRREMAKHGWESEDDLTVFGWGDTPGYSIWFGRYEWAGLGLRELGGIKIVFHCHVPDLNSAEDAVRAAAMRCIEAHEKFPDQLPYQDSDGRVVAYPGYWQDHFQKKLKEASK